MISIISIVVVGGVNNKQMIKGKKNTKRKTVPKNNDIASNNTDYSSNNNNNNNSNNNLTNSSGNLSAKTVKIIPVMEENFDLSKIKDTVAHSIASNDSNIEYHYPNSSLDSPDLSSASKPSVEKSESQNQYHDDNYNREGELVPLIEGQEKNETEKIVPIWGEEIIVSKRKVKLGEIIIRKKRIIENKKIDVDIKKEKVIVEYPNGVKEELTTTASSSSP